MLIANGNRVSLRRAGPVDRARAYAWLVESDLAPRSFGPPLYPERPPPTPDFFDKRYPLHYFDGTRPFDGRMLTVRAGNEDVGCIAHHAVDLYRDVVALELWLAEAGRSSRGYGSEAITLACEWLQDNFGVNRFLLRPSRRNVRALRAMRRAGFRETDLPHDEVLETLALDAPAYIDELLLFRTLPLPPAMLEREAGHTYVFVDSEFTNLMEPRLISFGAVATDATSFYCELNDWPRELCSDFVRRSVLPLLDGDAVPHAMAAKSLLRWIAAKAVKGPTVVVSDSGFDRWALADLLGREDLPAGAQWLRLPVAYETLDEIAAELGLRRHYALDDARALCHAALSR
jgi:diamine N-acetyltransferase